MSQCTAVTRDPTGWGRGYPCTYKAKVQREGKGYCGIHDPVKKAAREAEKRARWGTKSKARAKATMEEDRKLDTWDGLLAACELAIENETCVCEGKEGGCLHCILTAAVEAAR